MAGELYASTSTAFSRKRDTLTISWDCLKEQAEKLVSKNFGSMGARSNTRIVFLIVLLFRAVTWVSGQDTLKSLPQVSSQSEFDSLAVTYDPDTPYALPHVLFVIDRQD